MNYQDKSTIRKVFYTVLVVFVSLVLSHIPVYGIKSDILSGVFSDRSMLSFTDILSGGSLSQLAVGGFGVTSMITASIVVQLAGVIFPKIEKYRSDGETGRRLFDKIELLMAVAITLLVSLVITVVGSNYYELDGFMKAIPVVEWLIGTVVIVKLAQSVQDNGIGNGQTLILAANIASRVPAEIVKRVVSEQPILNILILSAVLLITIVFAILLQSGFVSVKIQQTNKPVSIMNSEGIIPVPVSMSSVLPLIYASAIVSVPALVSSFTGKEDGILGYIMLFTTQSYWYNPNTWQNVVGFAVYILLVFLFSVYASKLSFSAPDIANRMRERGDVVPGVRPGEETEQYLDKRRRKLSIISAALIIIVAILPDFVFAKLGITGFSFMGTSLIILMAAFYDLRLRITGLLKQHNKKYSLFKEV